MTVKAGAPQAPGHCVSDQTGQGGPPPAGGRVEQTGANEIMGRIGGLTKVTHHTHYRHHQTHSPSLRSISSNQPHSGPPSNLHLGITPLVPPLTSVGAMLRGILTTWSSLPPRRSSEYWPWIGRSRFRVIPLRDVTHLGPAASGNVGQVRDRSA